MQIDKTKFKPFTKQEKQRQRINIFVYVVENQIMLFVNVQRSVDHM